MKLWNKEKYKTRIGRRIKGAPDMIYCRGALLLIIRMPADELENHIREC